VFTVRRLLLAFLAGTFLVAAQAQAQDSKQDPPKKVIAQPKQPREVTLKVGDVPPPLVASKWLQGKEVEKLETGKVYVVEFWATWCGPCIVMMPHLAELHQQYKDKGVVIIGYSANGPDNSAKKVEEFVKKRGPKLHYTFAYADDRDSYNEWMQAAGRNGIPCTFVVGRDNKIAYIGHPMYLDVVLPKVVAGTWKSDVDGATIDALETEVKGIFKAVSGKDAEAGLKTLTDFQTKYPELNKIPYFIAPKINLLLKQEKLEDAKAFAESVLADAVKHDDTSMISNVASALVGPAAKKNKALADVAVSAAYKLEKIAGPKDLNANITLARVLFATGDKAKAKEHAEKAVDLAPENSKGAYRNMLKQFLGDAEGSNEVRPQKLIPAGGAERREPAPALEARRDDR
jgi:thiol-disulfide isomerase/thioredoxin